MKGAPLRKIRIGSISHQCRCPGLSLRNRQLCRHAFWRSRLESAAERHQNGGCANRAVKSLNQAPLTADVQIGEICQPCGFHITGGNRAMEVIILCRWRFHLNFCMLPHTIGVQKLAADIHDCVAAPIHPQPPRPGHPGHQSSFKILSGRQFDEPLRICSRHHYRHPFLRFGNGQLRTIQTLIFLRHCIQINIESVRQFANRHRHAAGAKVIALLDQAADLGIAKQSLNLAFRGCISLLDLCAAGCQRLFRMCF